MKIPGNDVNEASATVNEKKEARNKLSTVCLIFQVISQFFPLWCDSLANLSAGPGDL